MADEDRALRAALIGCGNLGSAIARGIARGAAGDYRLTAVLDASVAKADALAAETGAVCCVHLDQLLDTRPAYVIEAATGSVLQEVAVACLRVAHLVILSTGALADERFRATVERVAQEHGRKIHVASGALGGFDLAQAARAAGALNLTLRTQKPPHALAGAPSQHGRVLSEDEEQEVFRGTARQAIAAFPQNVNVAVALSLAGTGLDETTVTVASKPGATRNRHIVELEGAFGAARLEIEARPSPDNPKSSLLAAYSVLALLRKLRAPIQI
jgi:aspartate dehydrogenase